MADLYDERGTDDLGEILCALPDHPPATAAESFSGLPESMPRVNVLPIDFSDGALAAIRAAKERLAARERQEAAARELAAEHSVLLRPMWSEGV